jgi:hypothetical protein
VIGDGFVEIVNDACDGGGGGAVGPPSPPQDISEIRDRKRMKDLIFIEISPNWKHDSHPLGNVTYL